jgi:hypothetical protein
LSRKQLSKIQKVIANFLLGRWLAASQEWNHWRFVESNSEEVRHRSNVGTSNGYYWTDSKTSEKSCANEEREIGGASARGDPPSLLLIVRATPSLNSDRTGEDVLDYQENGPNHVVVFGMVCNA